MDCAKAPPRRSSPILLRNSTLVFLRELVDHARAYEGVETKDSKRSHLDGGVL